MLRRPTPQHLEAAVRVVYLEYIITVRRSRPMVRTQIYLTPEEQDGLRSLSRQTGLSQSELIRQAIDSMLAQKTRPDRASLLSQARGLWSGRTDLPDLTELRSEMDRLDRQTS